MSSNIHNYFTLNSEHDWEDLYIQLRNQQTCTSDNHKWIRGRSIFNPVFGRCFSTDLQMQHEFRCVNLIGRSWRTKNEPNNTHIPYMECITLTRWNATPLCDARNFKEDVEERNNTHYGLQSDVFTNDLNKAFYAVTCPCTNLLQIYSNT
jgi:hypothetical protein